MKFFFFPLGLILSSLSGFSLPSFAFNINVAVGSMMIITALYIGFKIVTAKAVRTVN